MKKKICIVGLGYIGLPLAQELSKYFEVTGFDTNKKRIYELENGFDRNFQIDKKNLKNNKIKIVNNFNQLSEIDIFIVTVPTPIKKNKVPDLNPLIKATKSISSKLKKR